MSPQQVLNVPIDELVCTKQVREEFNTEALAGLARSIRETGVLVPVLARKDNSRYVVTDGERRVRAARIAGLAVVPVIVEEQAVTAGEVLLRQLVTNCQREGLTPMELSRAFEHLMREARWTAAEVAQRLGLSPATVSKHLALLTLPDELQQQVHTRQIPFSSAYEIAKVKNSVERDELAAKVTSGLSRDKLVAAKKAKRQKPKQDQQVKDAAGAIPRVRVSFNKRRSITFSAPALTVDALVACLEQCLAKIKLLQGQGVELQKAIKLLPDSDLGTEAGA